MTVEHEGPQLSISFVPMAGAQLLGALFFSKVDSKRWHDAPQLRVHAPQSYESEHRARWRVRRGAPRRLHCCEVADLQASQAGEADDHEASNTLASISKSVIHTAPQVRLREYWLAHVLASKRGDETCSDSVGVVPTSKMLST